nr:reverse transcriptase domain-containing protein [Tanacetum cinerariifolium]
MSTRSSARNLFPPLDNPELTIQRRSRVDPTLLNDFEMATVGNGDPPVPDLRTMEELCQPTLNGRGGPIAPIAIQATNFGLKNDMIQQVQYSCQFHGLPGDDANKHLDKFLHVTHNMKVNGVTDEALRLYLFPYSLTHHATAWFDRLLRNSITTFEQMAKMFLGKYFPPSMVTKLRNEITNFPQHPDESLFKAWERYKLSIDRCPNHNMLHDTSIQRSESSSSITCSSDLKIVALKAEMAEINKNLMKVPQINQQVKAVAHNCKTYGGPHSYNDCPATVGQTQNVYAAGAYNQGGNSYQPQGNRNLLSYRSKNYLEPSRFNQNQNRNNQNQNYQNQNRNQGNNHGIPQGNNQGRNQFFQGATHGQNPPPAYQEPAYQAPDYQDPVHQALIPQPQVVTITEFTHYMKVNDAILKNIQTNMTSLSNSNLELKNMFGKFMKMNTASSSGSGTLPSNTITKPKEDLKGITTRSGTAYQGPTIPTTFSLPKVVEHETEVRKDTVPPTNNRSTKDIQPPVVQTLTPMPNSEPVVAPVVEPVVALISASKPNSKLSIPYPSGLHDQKLRDKNNDQKEKIFKIIIDLDFNISFADALILMPKFGPTIKSLLTNKEKLFELARTPLNEHCSECLALADLGTSINLMPLSVWNKLSLPELSPTCMTLELADRLISRLVGVVEDVFIKVETFHFLVDFVVVEFDADPRVPLILGRSFLKTGRALTDIYKGEVTLYVGKEAVTFNLDQTLRYSANYDAMSVNRINLIDVACEEYSQEVLLFSMSGNPTPSTEPIVSNYSPTLTPFGDSDFLLEEIDAFLAIDDEPVSPEIDDYYYDSEGYILLLEEFLNDDPSSPPLPQQELKIIEPTNEKSSIDEPPVVELKDLPPDLEYAFLEGDDKLPIIIAKDLKDEEKIALVKISMEDDFKPAVQHQRRVNPKIHELIKKEVLKLLDAGLIYPISDSPWVMLKYGVTHRLAIAYHPQTSGQVEVSNRGLKRIWERTVGENHASWSDKLDDALWAFRTAFKTTIGCTPYKLVYGKACHVPIELEQKAYWALKHCNYDLLTAGDHQKVQLNELNELRNQDYENSLIYKEKTKRIHDSKIKDRVFNVGD